MALSPFSLYLAVCMPALGKKSIQNFCPVINDSLTFINIFHEFFVNFHANTN